MISNRRLSRIAIAGALTGLTALATLPSVAWAQHEDHDHSAHNADVTPGKLQADHKEASGEHHGPGQINWVYGLIAESNEVQEPNLLFRPKGMPAPFLATLINFGAVIFLLMYKAGPAITQSLQERRDELLKGSESATKAKQEAQARFDEQQKRLDKMDEEIARIRTEYAEQGKLDLERIEHESIERHDRFVREAKAMVEQEGRALRLRLLHETAEEVTASAEQTLLKQIRNSDQERLANEYLSQLGALTVKRGEA